MDRYFKILIWILLIYSIIIAFFGIAFDAFNTIKYGGIDLRNRVVGARLLLDGRDPYFTKWDEETPDYFLDGRDYYDLPVSRCTVTPSLLLLHMPLAKISYKTQQYIWFALQEILLLVSIFLLAKMAKEHYKIVLIIGFMFQFGGYFWRFHVANGQIYVLFLFLITLAYLIDGSARKNSSFWSGFVLGITAVWRPPVLIMGLPFLIFKKWKLLLGGICGIFTGFIPSVFFSGWQTWKNYFSAMRIIEKFHIGIFDVSFHIHPRANFVEGVKNSFFSADVPGLDTSVQGILYNKFNLVVNSACLWIALILISIILCFPLIRNRTKEISRETLFLGGSVLLFMSEFFLPGARLSYNNVLWFFPVSLLIIKVWKIEQQLQPALIFFGLAILGNYLYNLHPLSIMFADYAMLIYLIWMWFAQTDIGKGFSGLPLIENLHD